MNDQVAIVLWFGHPIFAADDHYVRRATRALKKAGRVRCLDRAGDTIGWVKGETIRFNGPIMTVTAEMLPGCGIRSVNADKIAEQVGV